MKQYAAKGVSILLVLVVLVSMAGCGTKSMEKLVSEADSFVEEWAEKTVSPEYESVQGIYFEDGDQYNVLISGLTSKVENPGTSNPYEYAYYLTQISTMMDEKFWDSNAKELTEGLREIFGDRATKIFVQRQVDGVVFFSYLDGNRYEVEEDVTPTEEPEAPVAAPVGVED